MINTFHTSYNPPPVPPRAGYSKPHPVGNTSLVKFLSVMLLLLMILTFGGFLYLFQKLSTLKQLQEGYLDEVSLERLRECADNSMGEGSMAQCGKLMEKYKATIAKVSQLNENLSKLTGGPHFIGPAAHMTALSEHKDKLSRFFKKSSLLWDEEHSLVQEVRLSNERDKLIIQYPGIYFIYSQVTFSKNSALSSLKQSIRITVPKKQDKELLKSFCSLKPGTQNLCTASQAGVFHLEKDQQLYVAVTNTSLVNRDSCNFGLFKLR
ncbi:CD40 ligand [Puntigrus tetrazona]|uniref:CD40 ligand n=1 Tax=Puntigrus tetrazona TaxID=1606681 RepID=UPI001C8A9A52|nr:CD40 ligand [Puntigrus tetrazona]